jgi:hypothetical protein
VRYRTLAIGAQVDGRPLQGLWNDLTLASQSAQALADKHKVKVELYERKERRIKVFAPIKKKKEK